MTRIDFDMSELDRWHDVLEDAPSELRRKRRKVVERGSFNIKRDAQRDAPHGPHTPHYARSITYDVDEDINEVVGEIGPQRGRRQWGLGNILEYGTRNNPPHPHLEPALDREEFRFLVACADLAEEVLDE